MSYDQVAYIFMKPFGTKHFCFLLGNLGVRKRGNVYILTLIDIDDIILLGNDDHRIAKIKMYLDSMFGTNILCRYEVTRTPNDMVLSENISLTSLQIVVYKVVVLVPS